MNFSELKEKARKSMKGNYMDAIIMVLIVGFISGVVGFIAGTIDGALGLSQNTKIVIFNTSYTSYSAGLFTSLASIIVSGFFGFGIINYFLKRSRNEEVTWKNVFDKKDLTIYFIVISLIVSIFTFLWSLLLIIPGIIAAFSYTMVYMVKLDNPEIGYMDAIRKSKELMKGHKWEYFLFNLSFIGWMILGIFTLGILYFWLVPYMSVAQCNFYNKLLEK